jgi:hypothetical protein
MSALPILSQSAVTSDGKWEGWCWYPDEPLERAIVEVFVGPRSLKAVRSARLRTDIRDLGMGDGYCGFQLTLPPRERGLGGALVELRERRFGRVIGRVVFDQDGLLEAKETRLGLAGDALGEVAGRLGILSAKLARRAEHLEELGAILSYHSKHRGHRCTDSLMGALAAGKARLASVPHADLGGSRQPHVTLLICAPDGGNADDAAALAADLCAVAASLPPQSAEFIVVDGGTAPFASLLPARLRNLQMVRMMPVARLGTALNTAALAARGTWLAMAHIGSIGVAQLAQVIAEAVEGTCHIEAEQTASQYAIQHHRLKALMTRRAFVEMGGCDSQLEGPALWENLLERAILTGQRVVRWRSPLDMRCTSKAGRDCVYV